VNEDRPEVARRETKETKDFEANVDRREKLVTTVKMENAERKENGVSMDSQDQPVPNVGRRETREKTEPPVKMDHPEAHPPKVIVVPMVWTDPLERREIRERGVAMDKQDPWDHPDWMEFEERKETKEKVPSEQRVTKDLEV